MAPSLICVSVWLSSVGSAATSPSLGRRFLNCASAFDNTLAAATHARFFLQSRRAADTSGNTVSTPSSSMYLTATSTADCCTCALLLLNALLMTTGITAALEPVATRTPAGCCMMADMAPTPASSVSGDDSEHIFFNNAAVTWVAMAASASAPPAFTNAAREV